MFALAMEKNHSHAIAPKKISWKKVADTLLKILGLLVAGYFCPILVRHIHLVLPYPSAAPGEYMWWHDAIMILYLVIECALLAGIGALFYYLVNKSRGVKLVRYRGPTEKSTKVKRVLAWIGILPTTMTVIGNIHLGINEALKTIFAWNGNWYPVTWLRHFAFEKLYDDPGLELVGRGYDYLRFLATKLPDWDFLAYPLILFLGYWLMKSYTTAADK